MHDLRVSIDAVMRDEIAHTDSAAPGQLRVVGVEFQVQVLDRLDLTIIGVGDRQMLVRRANFLGSYNERWPRWILGSRPTTRDQHE